MEVGMLAFGMVVGSLFALTGLVIAAVGLTTLGKWFASRHWPQAPARIVASEVREVQAFEDQTMYRPEVEFTFVAGFGEVTGKNLAFANKLYSTRAQAAKAVARYPVGMMVMARYDPRDPAQAVLMRRGGLAGFLLAALGLAMTLGPLFAAERAGMPVRWLAGILSGVAGTALLLAWWAGRSWSRARSAGIYPAPGQGRDEDVERLVRQGEKILAIRLYRELHGTGLKLAKQRVEEIASRIIGK